MSCTFWNQRRKRAAELKRATELKKATETEAVEEKKPQKPTGKKTENKK